ncbi:MAG: glycosyltransferase family 2 protein [Gammaproteobacteria bacterium]|nr:glycosyltransferase family 2 protein [Gammaproteobacteria bacterium]
MTQLVSIVIPVYDESAGIEDNLKTILAVLEGIEGTRFQVLVVDDGSGDDTADKVRRLCEKRDDLELLCLNRNFGKEAAVHAGLMHAAGDAVVVMDSDLQHPPHLIPSMIELWGKGIEVVEACKSSRGKETMTSRLLAQGFYNVFNTLTGFDIKNKSDFKLLDRKVVEAYCAMPERKRFFRGMIPWLGFNTAQVYFDVPERAHGKSAWPRMRLMRFSLTALSSFTSTPLHLVTLLGLLFLVISVVLGGIALYDKFTGTAVSGFTTVILLVLITGSLTMFALGQIGIYIEQIFDEVKSRPTYLVNERKSYVRKSD